MNLLSDVDGGTLISSEKNPVKVKSSAFPINKNRGKSSRTITISSTYRKDGFVLRNESPKAQSLNKMQSPVVLVLL